MRTQTRYLQIAALVLLASPLSAATVDEVIAKHVAARGGDAWGAIESLKLEGDFTAFSQVAPFTMLRKRAHKVHVDCQMNGNPVEIGFDGEDAWQINGMFNVAWPQKIGGLDHQVLMLDVDLATPFFDYKKRGYTAELLENADIDGQEVLQVKLTRPDEFAETWYLDPGTYLEVARDSPGSDFGRPAPQRTVFDDFREVGGVQIPHYHETQWYTRTRVYEIASVETNVEVDDAIFAMPPPPGMDKLLVMAGEWHVKVEQRPQPGVPWSTSEQTRTVESDLDELGALYTARSQRPPGLERRAVGGLEVR